MLEGYPFWGDAMAPTTATILDPLLRAAVTTLTFRGTSRVQKLVGISVACDTPTLLNTVRVRVGNSLPDYRRITVPCNAFDNDLAAGPQIDKLNFFDLGGLEVLEGETLEITGQGAEGGAGTGHFSGVLWVENMEPGPIPIPNGNIICLVLGDGADAGTAIAAIAALDARNLENNRLYTPFMAMVECEDQNVEASILMCGNHTITFPPSGKMVYPSAAVQFSGLEYNSGAVALFGQTNVAGEINIYLYCIESAIPSGPQPINAPAVQGVSSLSIPGATSVASIIGTKGALVKAPGTMTAPRMQLIR